MIETEKNYYIKDQNFNFYRLNQNNQLVVASENEATIFSYVEANKRVGSGPKSKFYFMVPVPEELEPVKVEIENESAEDFNEMLVSTIKELTEGEVTEDVEKTISEYDLSKVDWKEYLSHFTYIVAGLSDYKERLLKDESDVDQKICDVLHYIELCDTDEDEAADLVELLRVCRENRRAIKDEFYKVDTFQRNFGTSANMAKAKEALKCIKGLETRKYAPRKFAELFNGELKAKRSSIKRATEPVYEEPEVYAETEEAEESYEMSYERRETVFDGKKNDWMSFAIQQAEFYRNAGQYMINLKLDIENIDKEIAGLMDEIETANCNATQGYKYFRRLKDLRIAQTEKKKELESLYILTGNIDLEIMADECDRITANLEDYLYGSNVVQEEGTTEDTSEADAAAEKSA